MQKVFKLGVVGNPIAHSRSPEIHQQFAEQTSVALTYDKFLQTDETLADFIDNFFQEPNAQGLNITLPFKQGVIPLCQQLTKAAKHAGAVNTIKRLPSGELLGDNTDGAGLLQDFKRLAWPIKELSIVVLGAGGAAKGIVSALDLSGINNIRVINRTQVNADMLIQRFDCCTDYQSVESSTNKPLLVINTCSQGAVELIEQYHVDLQNSFVYDISYGDRSAGFLQYCQQQGSAATADGIGMLVSQAALAFQCWFDVLPDVEPVLQQLNFS